MRLTLLGIGAMASPHYRPAGLLVEHATTRVMLDGGPRAAPRGPLDAWLVTDERGELMPGIRKLAKRKQIEPQVSRFTRGRLAIEPRRVVHTSRPAFGYLIRSPRKTAVWAPEFYRFPRWARGAATQPRFMSQSARAAPACAGSCSPTSAGPRFARSSAARLCLSASSAKRTPATDRPAPQAPIRPRRCRAAG